MTIHQIECFLEAARTLNFTEAANHLYISQQGLSRQIASLEKELELRLSSVALEGYPQGNI